MGRLSDRGKYSLRLMAAVWAVALAAAPAAADGRAQSGRHAAPKKVEREAQGVPDIPRALPDTVAVMPFENRSGVQGLDWMSAGVPFSLGEKVAEATGLRPMWGPMVVPDGAAAAVDPPAVARFAARMGARYVFTGWVERPNWDLQLGVSLWRIDGEAAVQLGEVVARNDFKHVHAMIGAASIDLLGKAGFDLDEEARAELARVPSKDFYAFTLFGRGVAAMVGTTGRDLAKAEKDLSRAVFIDPGLAEAQRALGELYRLQGKLDRARGRFSYALDLRPRYYPALAAKAALTAERGREPQARELYEAMLGQRPWDLEARFQLGKVLWEMGEIDLSRRELTRVVGKDADHIRARRILVLIHATRGDGADLVRELEQVSRLDPDDLATRLDLGAAYASVGREADAVATYEAIVARHPAHIGALKFLGDLHKGAGRIKQAVSYYKRALDVDPSDPRPYFLLGAAYVEAGEDDAAKQIYRRAQRFKRYHGEIYNALGAIAYRERKMGESLWYLKRAVEKKPDNAIYRYNYGLSLSSAGDLVEARAQVRQGLQLSPQHVQMNYLYGVVLLKLGDAEGARKAFEKTLALEPKHADAQHNLGKLEELERRIQQGEIVVEGK